MVLEAMSQERFVPAFTPALFLEYESVLKRPEHLTAFRWTPGDVDNFLDAVLALGQRVASIRYRWRPVLSDANDDLVLECGVASNSTYIVTQNVNDFRAAIGQFELKVSTPWDL